MDFFETQERYRRQEMRGWILFLARVVVVGGVLWIGWLWGHAEQTSLQAEADLVIYENNQRIDVLTTQVQDLERVIAENNAKKKTSDLIGGNQAELRDIITKQIARGVTPEQIMSSLKSLGKPINCREVARHDVAVATPLYAGPESKLELFSGGLNLFVEGHAGKRSERETPWFNPASPVRIRHAFLNGQKIIEGVLPLETIIPAEEWVLKLNYIKSDLRGYITTIVSSCVLR
jgi:hypothetical protein